MTSGFTITEHPAAKAVEIFLDAKIMGKFKELVPRSHLQVGKSHVF